MVLLQKNALGRSAPSLNPNSEIETADSADFTDFKGVIGDERTNLFLVKLQGVYNCNLLYPCDLRNLRLNPFSVFGLNRSGSSSLNATKAETGKFVPQNVNGAKHHSGLFVDSLQPCKNRRHHANTAVRVRFIAPPNTPLEGSTEPLAYESL
jgi:hypothetical protein